MKLSDVIKVHEIAVVRSPTGVIGFADLDYALDQVVGVENDLPNAQPELGGNQ